MEREFEKMDSSGKWQNLYNDIRNQAIEYPYKIAKLPMNRNLNRYRDVSPYDHSRVKLENSENDYINASLVAVKEAERAYILSQGPLRNTCGHFWLMIWEQCSKAVIMLNRVIEKGSEKCAQYWPTPDEPQMSFTDTGFVVRLLSEEDQSHYTIRVLELENTKTGESRQIYHFHYTTWPDFGVPESPASFLNFLFKVRESGSLGPEHGPSVVHCSAGIGRSGTFALVDTCLVLMDRSKSSSSVDIQKVLLDMREYRMGLIQTPDQLRFSYMSIIEGAKNILSNVAVEQISEERLLRDHLEPEMAPPTPPPRPHLNDSRPNGPCLDPEPSAGDPASAGDPCRHSEADNSVQLRKRHREERIAGTAQKVLQMKQKLTDSEKRQEKWQYWRPILLNVGAGTALLVGVLCLMYFQ
ncbi:tyrosine-protein phosphatase non-receptor type 2a [Cyprinodon tularosa]|uniref:Tyrosine-protein phosphatase non-receptor type n=1 Tax=Cyprinodon variegatus TaxID=28743 RepID=A0A3Q2FMU8_CYPVA|nr:PREDICTED: tyrosine-protein phosphatase non-receptor type 2-like [Cyprinodon variegatus]XP_038162186.1 tyrosine-protein phosphatase non-receptor type 2a [Cyprinodon tularosa]